MSVLLVMKGFQNSKYAACQARNQFPVRIHESADVLISVLGPEGDMEAERCSLPSMGKRTEDRWAFRWNMETREILGFLGKGEFDRACDAARLADPKKILTLWDIQTYLRESKRVCANCVVRNPGSDDCDVQLYGPMDAVYALALLGRCAGLPSWWDIAPIQDLIQRFELLRPILLERAETEIVSKAALLQWVDQFQIDGEGMVVPIEWAQGFAASFIYTNRELPREEMHFLQPRLCRLADGCSDVVKELRGESVDILVSAFECLKTYQHQLDMALRFGLTVQVVC